MAEENVVDTLEIEIRSRASKAAEEVASLAASVGDFGKSVSTHIKDMTSFADAVAKIAESLSKLSQAKGLKSVLDSVSKAARKEKDANIGRVFKPAIPPTVLSGTVKGKTRNVDLTRIGYGPYKYDKSADEIAKEINNRYRTGISNKAISAEIQRIRNEMTGGNTRWAGEAHGLAKDIAGNAQSEELTDSLKNAINRCYSTIAVSFEDAVHLARQYGKTKAGYSKKRELEALFREYVQQARLKTLSDQEARSYITRSGGLAGVNKALKNAGVNAQIVYSSEGHGFEDLFAGEMRSAEEFKNPDEYELKEAIDGLADRHVETVVDALLGSKDNGSKHDAFLSKYNEGRGITEAELTQDLWSYLADEIGAGKPIDPAEERAIAESETKRAVERAAQEAKEAVRIAKEESAAWKEQDAWNREQDRQYKEDYGGINKRQQMNLAWSERARESVPSEIDETRRLIDDYNASENEKYEAYMKELAEGIVQSQASGGTADIKSIVEEATGISRAMKDAEDSARAMMDAMNQPEAFKSARESAETFQRTWQETGAEQARAAREASRATWEAEMEQIRAYGDAKKAAAEQDALMRALRDNTPELIAARRSRADKMGILEGYDKMFSTNIPGLADRGLAAGLIDENTANAMKEAAGCATDMKHELEGAGEAAGDTADKIGEIADECEGAEENTFSLKKALSAVGGMISKSIVGQLARVAKMRGLRAIVKGLASGFKEGIGNMYQWSKGLGGHFASALDTASTKLLLIKNSVATAFAPALEALVPALSRVTSWINAASNAVAQFMAKLTGASTWTKATESVQEWAKDATASTEGVSGAVKDLLADWDELNIIQSEAGGSGGGSGSKNITDYSKMFEETSVFDDWTDFFDEIKTSVIAIGAGIAGWFLLDTATSFLEKIGYASDKVAGIKNTIARGMAGAVLLTVGLSLASAAGKGLALEGITVKTIGESIGGIIAAGIGGHFVGGFFGKIAGGLAGASAGGTIGLIAGVGIAVAVELDAYITKKRELAYSQIAKNSFAMAGAGGFSISEYKAAVEKELNTRMGNLSVAISAFDNYGTAKQNLQDAKKSIQELGAYVFGSKKMTKEQAEEFQSNWQIVFESVEQMHTSTWDTIDLGIAEAMRSQTEESKAALKELQQVIIEARATVGGTLTGYRAEMSQIVTRITLGMATDEDVERYKKLSEVIAGLESGNRTKKLEEFNKEIEAIDFGKDENAVENALSFIEEMKTVYGDATSEAEEFGKTESEAIEVAKQEIEAAFQLGDIEEDDYYKYLNALDDWSEKVKDKVAKDKEEIERLKEETYGKVIGQVLMGAVIKNAAGGSIDQYYSDVIKPIFQRLKESGIELPKELDNGVTYWDPVQKVFDFFGDTAEHLTHLFGGEFHASDYTDTILPALRNYLGDDYDEFMKSVFGEDNKFESIPLEVKPTATAEDAFKFKEELEEQISNYPVNVSAEVGTITFSEDGNWEWKPSEQKTVSFIEEIQEQVNDNPITIPIEYDDDDEDVDIGDLWDTPTGSTSVGGGGGSPTGWFSGAEEGFMDVDASGIATADSVEQGAALVNGGMEQIQNMIATVNSFLRNIEEYNRITAGKDLTVNITPSSGFAQTMRRSGARLEAVTGTVLKR